MRINIVFPNISRKTSGGHKVLYEYCNMFACDDNSVSIYYYPAELFTSYHAPELIRVPMVKIYAFLFGTCCWFPLNKSIKARVIDHASDMRRADVVIATGVSTAEPVSNLSEKYGKKSISYKTLKIGRIQMHM